MLKSLPKPFLILGIVIIISVGFLGIAKSGLVKPLSQITPSSTVPSEDILFLTQPVTSLSGGKIERIEDNIIWVSQAFTLGQLQALNAVTTPGQPPVIPTPVTKKITYKVTIGPNTQINRPEPFTPYLFKTVTPAQPPKLTIKDLTVNQVINNISANNIDLRTLKTAEFEASFIQLSPIINNLLGTVEKVSGNTILLKTVSPPAPLPADETNKTNTNAPQEKIYTVTVTDETEISRYSRPKTQTGDKTAAVAKPTPPSPEKVDLNALTPGSTIMVYTDVDVNVNDKFIAFRIEPSILTGDILPSSAVPRAPVVPQSEEPAD